MLMAVEGVVLVWCNYFEPAFGYMCAIFRAIEMERATFLENVNGELRR